MDSASLQPELCADALSVGRWIPEKFLRYHGWLIHNYNTSQYGHMSWSGQPDVTFQPRRLIIIQPPAVPNVG